MRDPRRIKNILELIEKVWRIVPDWRFGQLVENVLREETGNEIINQLFYIEDSEFEEMLNNILKKVSDK